jgi:FkbM family methyltransferase
MKTLVKRIYRLVPFKQQLFTALKTVWKPGEKIYRHLHFKGIIKVRLDKKRSFKMKHYGFQVENEIFWVGLTNAWEKESFKLWIKLSAGAGVILDIGANTGIYSLISKAVNPGAKVYAFEPVERVFKKLQENIGLNDFDIVAVEKAVSNQNGTAIIYDLVSEHVYSVTVNKNMAVAGTQTVETTINTITLNSFLKDNNVGKVDLVKIDVETHEPEVLEGFSDYLSRYRPTLLIEILNDEIGSKVNDMVKGLGYLYFNIDERGGIRQVDRITRSDYYNYLLCDQQVARGLGLLN